MCYVPAVWEQLIRYKTFFCHRRALGAKVRPKASRRFSHNDDVEASSLQFCLDYMEAMPELICLVSFGSVQLVEITT